MASKGKQKAATKVNSSKKEREQFEKDLQEMFRLFDKDGDRSISTSEMGQVLRGLGFDMTNRELAQALKKIDTNGNGVIEYGEFRTFMMRQFEKSSSDKDKTKEIRQAFRLFDRDGNGYIERNEFRRAMKTLGEPLTESELDQMMKEGDTNNDGKIDYEEFVILWAKKTEERSQT